MKQLLILFIGACLCMASLSAQDIESTLGGSTITHGFTIKDGSGSTLFRLRGDGRLGIGTTSPFGMLHVVNTTPTTNGIRITCGTQSGVSGLYVDQTGAGNAGRFSLDNSSSSDNGLLAETNGTGAAISANSSNATGKILELVNGAISRFQVSSTGVVSMDGNLGIGTTSPIGKVNITTSSNHSSNAIRINPWQSTGSAILIYQNGNGNAARFDITNSASTNNCLEVNTNAATPAIYANSTNASGRILQANNSTNARFFVESSGNVGIGVDDATQDLDVLNSARFRGVYSSGYSAPLNITSTGVLTTATSDARLKTDIRPLGSSLWQVMKLRGVRYHWKNEPEAGERIGFIAQEVREVVPEVVYTNPTDGYLGLNYAELTAVLVEAVKEQQAQIEEQQALIEVLQASTAKTAALQARVATLEAREARILQLEADLVSLKARVEQGLEVPGAAQASLQADK